MSPFSLRLLYKTLTIIWYLNPWFSSNKSINKSLLLDLLASYWAKSPFESIILIL